MDRSHIIEEIRRTAKFNGGQPLGVARFKEETGIARSDWYGKHWARWGDALVEAGYSPNKLQGAYDDTWVLEQLIAFIRELGHYPVSGELRMKAKDDVVFPHHNVFRRLGRKAELAHKVIEYCEGHSGYEDVVDICSPIAKKEGERTKRSPDNFEVGYVYLIKSGKHYKVGRTNAPGRREYELAIQLPEKANTIHVIKTDDPAGIEAYWHRRFANKRRGGEWFELGADDIKAFKRRKFM